MNVRLHRSADWPAPLRRAAGSYERAAEDVANAGDADALASALGRFRTERRAFARLLLARDRERRPHLYRHAL